MSAGLMCDCPLPPMDGLKPSDNGHYRRGWAPEQRDCPQYAEDQERGGMCAFCRDAHILLAAPEQPEWCPEPGCILPAHGDERHSER